MGSSRNRVAGSNWELNIISRFNQFQITTKEGESIPLFPVVGTTRNLSRKLDSMKLDVYTENPQEFKDFGLLIQAKTTASAAKYPLLLNELEEVREMLGGIPVIYHKQTKRVQKNESKPPRFMSRGEYAILKAKDFEELVVKNKILTQVYEEYSKYFDSLPEEVQTKMNNFLKERNL